MKTFFICCFLLGSTAAFCQVSVGAVNDSSIVFTKVEQEPAFPGGPKAWSKYLVKQLRYPVEAQDGEVQGTVNLQFIVDVNGNVSDIQVIDGPEELRRESIRLIRESGKWVPAMQNGRPVKAYKKQHIIYRLG